MLDYFLVGTSNILESLLVAWQQGTGKVKSRQSPSSSLAPFGTVSYTVWETVSEAPTEKRSEVVVVCQTNIIEVFSLVKP